ncbi:hypothetical protein ACFFX0_19490 [Citricoccus parietis]|uniref:Uncharacterized protein n=1 Tax=Citricoccus parietis TaxID=592307 RepID=A0ABV5G2V2_9MICC
MPSACWTPTAPCTRTPGSRPTSPASTSRPCSGCTGSWPPSAGWTPRAPPSSGRANSPCGSPPSARRVPRPAP